MIADVRPGDRSPIGRLTLELDRVYADLLKYGKGGEAVVCETRGRARGLAFALSVITCYSEDEVRTIIKQRHTGRKDDGSQPKPRRRAASR